ncbi:MAG: hypothetical protein JSS50_02690 [Proteobacteria bacterium]|nr:hypothetical protein [Pseudomonadota bacterium]
MRFPFRDFRAEQDALQNAEHRPTANEHDKIIIEQPVQGINQDLTADTNSFTYSLEEIELIKQQAFAAGQAEALQMFAKESEQVEREKVQALEQIAKYILMINEQLHEAKQRHYNECISLAIAIARKIISNTSVEVVAAGTLSFVRTILDKATPPAPVLITVHQSIQSLVEQACSEMIKRKEIEVVVDHGLGLSDCKIEWSDGMVVKNTNQILDEISALLGSPS